MTLKGFKMPKAKQRVKSKQIADRKASSVVMTEEVERLKSLRVQQKSDLRTARMTVITANTQLEHTEAQLKGVRTMLGELIWD